VPRPYEAREPGRPAIRSVAILLSVALVGVLGVSCSPEQRLLHRVRSLYSRGDLDAALETARRVIDLDPSSDEAYYYVGMVQYSRDRYVDALQAFDSAVELQGDEPRYLLQRGDTLCRLRRYAEAIRDYERVLEIEPGDPRATYSIGIAHYDRREYPQAVEWLKRYERLTHDPAERARARALIEMLER